MKWIKDRYGNRQLRGDAVVIAKKRVEVETRVDEPGIYEKYRIMNTKIGKKYRVMLLEVDGSKDEYGDSVHLWILGNNRNTYSVSFPDMKEFCETFCLQPGK